MAFIDLHETFGLPQSRELPSNPLMAVTLAMTFKKLGGDFSISSTGQRYMGRAMHYMYGERGGVPLPQLPDTQPHEQFHNGDEWNGAMKLLDILIHRMEKADRDFVFDTLASITVDERGFVPSVDEPVRSVTA